MCPNPHTAISDDIYTQLGVKLMSDAHRELQFLADVLLGNMDPRDYATAELSFTNAGVALRAPDGSISRVFSAVGGVTTVPVHALTSWHFKGDGYQVVLVDTTGAPINVYPHDQGDPNRLSGFNQYVAGFSNPQGSAIEIVPSASVSLPSSGSAVQGSGFMPPAISPQQFDSAHVLEDNGQQISGFIEVKDADAGQSVMTADRHRHPLRPLQHRRQRRLGLSA